MSDVLISSIPVFSTFRDTLRISHYVSLPDDWVIGVSDIVNSTKAIESGHYKSVNLVGAAVICAVSNALDGDLPLFVFAGDGARFAVPPDKLDTARKALARVAAWAEREVGLRLRTGTMPVRHIREAGREVRVAFWKPSPNLRYAMFCGGGLDYAESQLKREAIALDPLADEDPDLTGLSCQWGPLKPRNGRIVSLILKAGKDSDAALFEKIALAVLEIIDHSPHSSQLSENVPEILWPGKAIALQARISRSDFPLPLRYLLAFAYALFSWSIFKLGLRLGGFEPEKYRREIAANTDFRKFDDGLIMTIDCSDEIIGQLRDLLEPAAQRGDITYGLHVQREALLTCVAPSVTASDHMHFVDGAGGGYVEAARHLRNEHAETIDKIDRAH